jgi:asparagine synthetase B (glutamine-hydrolysing)
MRLVALKSKEEGFESLWDGDGADRLFFGMNRTMLYNRVFKYYSLSKTIGLNKIFSMLTGFLHGNEMTKLHSLLKNWNIGIPPYPERKLDDLKWNKETEKEIFNIGVSRYYAKYHSVFKKYDLINYFTYQSVMMCPEMFFHPPYELQKSIGLYSVSPYWDTEIVKTALSIPAPLKTKKGVTKYILRKAAAFNDDKEYWMLPKIGLQNAYNFVISAKKGKDWESDSLKAIARSEFIEPVKAHLRSDKIDLKRLIPLYFWKNNLEK